MLAKMGLVRSKIHQSALEVCASVFSKGVVVGLLVMERGGGC